jgi:hypothetical protein
VHSSPTRKVGCTYPRLHEEETCSLCSQKSYGSEEVAHERWLQRPFEDRAAAPQDCCCTYARDFYRAGETTGMPLFDPATTSTTPRLLRSLGVQGTLPCHHISGLIRSDSSPSETPCYGWHCGLERRRRMCRRASTSCSALVLIIVGLSSAPAAACPWNGCGTDANNSAQRNAYYAPPYAYAPPVYGYAPQLSGSFYASPGYGYASPVYGYARRGYRTRVRR